MGCLLFIFSTFLIHAAEFEWSGELRGESHIYAEQLTSPTRQFEGILQSIMDFDLKFNRRSRLHFKPNLRSNVSTQQHPENLFLNMQEAYWEIKLETLKLKIGSNTHHWGVLDGYSTMDVTNGRVLFNPLSSEKRGAPGVHLSSEFGSLQIQALYIPRQARTLFPSTDSRWLPREVLVNASTADQTILLPSSFQYYYPGYQDLQNALDNNFGVKLDYRFSDIDTSLMFFEGTSINPQTRVQFAADVVSINPDVLLARTNVGIIPVYFKQRTVGTSATWTQDSFVMKLESTYSDSIPDDPIIPPWSWQNGVGVEIPWSLTDNTSATVLLQTYYGENKDALDNLMSSSTRLFDRSILLGLRVSFSTETNCTASFLYNYRDESSYARLQAETKWSEHWKSSLTVDALQGQSDTLLGTYDKNDRAILSLSYLF